MARIVDHPVRVARLRCGLSQNRLAVLAGVQRSALTAVEDGRTRRPNSRVLGVLASQLGVSVGELEREVELWWSRPVVPVLSRAAQNLLLIPPYVLGQYYSSFGEWRKEFAGSVTAFASLLRVNPAVVREFEEGRTVGMSDVLSSRLLEGFGLSVEYLVELGKLRRG